MGEGGNGSADYVLATAGTEVWLQPSGEIGLMGVASETTFLRGALDKLGIEPELDKRHEYKSAADRIMRTEFTPEHREAIDRVVATTWDGAVQADRRGARADHRRGARARRRRARWRPPRRWPAGWSTGSATATRCTPSCAPGSAPTSSCCSPIAGRRKRKPQVAPAEGLRGPRRTGTARSCPDAAGADRAARCSRATRCARRCGRPAGTSTPRPSCSGSIRPAARPSRPTRSGARCSCCARPASRWWCRWARSPARAATTSPARRT